MERIPVRIRRIGPPRWAKWEHGSEAYPGNYADELTGEQAEWGWAIPLIHRVLASPAEGLPMPKKPSPGCDSSSPFGYWSALLHLCLYRLGWMRPERGLLSLPSLNLGEDVDWFSDDRWMDPHIELLEQVWGRDGDLELFISWLTRWSLPQVLGSIGELTGIRFDESRTEMDAVWHEEQAARAMRMEYPTPAPGGDSLHLSLHCAGPLDNSADWSGEPGPPDLFVVGDDRRATLTVSSMVGWYRALILHANDLPDAGANVAIDVFSRPVGWLGTFRRSPNTGVWHSASEAAHLLAY